MIEEEIIEHALIYVNKLSLLFKKYGFIDIKDKLTVHYIGNSTHCNKVYHDIEVKFDNKRISNYRLIYTYTGTPNIYFNYESERVINELYKLIMGEFNPFGI